jgi:hypothetical protein
LIGGSGLRNPRFGRLNTQDMNLEKYEIEKPKFSRQATKILARVEKDLLRPLSTITPDGSEMGDGGSSSTPTDWGLEESYCSMSMEDIILKLNRAPTLMAAVDCEMPTDKMGCIQIEMKFGHS